MTDRFTLRLDKLRMQEEYCGIGHVIADILCELKNNMSKRHYGMFAEDIGDDVFIRLECPKIAFDGLVEWIVFNYPLVLIDEKEGW